MKKTAVLFTIFILCLVILADTGNLTGPMRVINDFPYGDKFGHFILYGLLNFFVTRAFLSSLPSRSRGWVTLSVGLILSFIIALEEFSQKYFATRTFSYLDLAASLPGVFIGGWAAYKTKRP